MKIGEERDKIKRQDVERDERKVKSYEKEMK